MEIGESSTKLVNIKIISGKELPEIVRAKNNLKEDDFAEIRIERNSPPKLRIIPIKSRPSSKWRESIEKENLLDRNFS